ncbi:ROK family protein [Liquorilactobacillus mali]|uniref:Fructokinase n=1 Tax=Liquorilactobacillus mali TaxID=1618 RepID=A0A0R2FNN1_9LACO|nr:fructokinase ScrK [Liquorilactobacillus mali]KRN26522.1 fructokinase branched chain amino acid 2-keto-4-methylthiobutyrate aminotransferase [Liquorilactobacillus mali]MDN7145775.1 ROK family protein [Liquorilactobacillus mali]
MLVGSVEAGGTKFVCAVGDENYRVKNSINFLTTTPKETLDKVIKYFEKFEIKALSIASFGPIEIKKNSSKYGYVTSTPKPYWANTDFVGYIQQKIKVPIFWTTDVNGSAYGEYVMATLANEKINSLVYYTLGTGVGGGAIINGNFVGNAGHPEMGHVFVKRHPKDLDFKGICPFHKDCLEGLVSGPTFEARVHKKGEYVSLDDPVWDIMAYYVAQAAMQVSLILRPDRIVFGGSVANKVLLQKVRLELKALLNDYLPLSNLENYITLPAIKNNGSATLGNFALAIKLLNS